MEITLNGSKRQLQAGGTIAALLDELGLSGKPVVVERNQVALLPKEIEGTEVHAGDVIEIVQITAGG